MLNESFAVFNRYGPAVLIEILSLTTVLFIIGNCQASPFFCAVITTGCGNTQQRGCFVQENENIAVLKRIRYMIFFIAQDLFEYTKAGALLLQGKTIKLKHPILIMSDLFKFAQHEP